MKPLDPDRADEAIHQAELVVDALIGYSLCGAPQGRTAELIHLCNAHAARVLSLDVPSGLDATTGQMPGVVVRPERTLTLALPKMGLRDLPGDCGKRHAMRPSLLWLVRVIASDGVNTALNEDTPSGIIRSKEGAGLSPPTNFQVCRSPSFSRREA